MLSPQGLGTQTESKGGKEEPLECQHCRFLLPDLLRCEQTAATPSHATAISCSSHHAYPPWWMACPQNPEAKQPSLPSCAEKSSKLTYTTSFSFLFGIQRFDSKCTLSKECVFGWFSLNKVIMSEWPCLLTHPAFVLCFLSICLWLMSCFIFFSSELEALLLICTPLVVNLVSLKCILNSFVEV